VALWVSYINNKQVHLQHQGTTTHTQPLQVLWVTGLNESPTALPQSSQENINKNSDGLSKEIERKN